ncbi:nucleoid DNA-binding protein [Desulfovibrio sp. X2]|uniref:baseplate complex protein n=1 Tax=Desulfovibrio sp. X2 TaxID=941449 RepID=UPI00035878BF|nr:hypothetical protein [Desulfovibrio sp. X2]EPR43151.1 nucleoid DNA-binding protein [Desulfovibrio sp. X2]
MSFLRLNDFTVPGYGLQVSLGLKFKDEDASGDTSAAAKAGKGTKGKQLECKIFIRFIDESDLRDLTRVAEARSGGSNTVYTVTNRTANAAGMRQGYFSGDFKADEQEGKRCWLVSFTLAEHISVPERAEARETPKPTTTQQNAGQSVTPSSADASSTEDLSPFEKWLKSQNAAIGDFEETQQ